MLSGSPCGNLLVYIHIYSLFKGYLLIWIHHFEYISKDLAQAQFILSDYVGFNITCIEVL